ncbi:MAG: GNAT family N-acetyltransferase [Phycisphaeraceae bacterium]|nr:MAG: GNAT family N-acetyltransferase [Phycisphaeraceae bacterium]
MPSQPHALAVGDSVCLRFPVEADRDAYIALRRDGREHLERWEPIPPPGFDPFGPDAFDREIACHQLDEQERWLIVRRDDGAIVGRLAITAIERGPFLNGRFGYWIGDGFTGRGYMTEAIRLGVRRAFTKMGLHRIEANIQPHNAASRRAVAKAGFRLVGYSPNYLQIRGRWVDHEHWAITKEMWEALPAPR